MSMGNNDFFLTIIYSILLNQQHYQDLKIYTQHYDGEKKLMGNDDIFIYQIFNIFQF